MNILLQCADRQIGYFGKVNFFKMLNRHKIVDVMHDVKSCMFILLTENIWHFYVHLNWSSIAWLFTKIIDIKNSQQTK